MRFLITGISGFVGEELANFFLKSQNNSVLGVDKNQFTSNSKVIFKKCDLVGRVFQKVRFDWPCFYTAFCGGSGGRQPPCPQICVPCQLILHQGFKGPVSF